MTLHFWLSMINYNVKINHSIKDELHIYESMIQNFFDVEDISINIRVINTRKEFEKIVDRKTSNWVVGTTKFNNIYVLKKMAIEKESSHKKEEFIQILKHEICHSYINKLNPLCAKSIEEGFCLNMAEQNKEDIIKKENYDLFFGPSNMYAFMNSEEFAQKQGYQLSYMIVRNIINNFSRQQIISLIMISRKDSNWKKEIEKITGKEFLEYEKTLKTNIIIK